MISFTPIGVVHNDINKMSTGNWADAESTIELDPDLVPGLQGLADFSHVVVVFHLDRIPPFDKAKQLLRQPRGMEHLAPVGVFAQRTKFRPNPIGVTPARLVSIKGNVITVAGLQLGALIAFALVTETVFAWPGVGQLFIQSVQFSDIPVMAAYLMLIGLLFVVINLVVDLLYFAVDPRLRGQGGAAKVGGH